MNTCAVSLRVPLASVEKRLAQVAHATFQEGLPRHWHVEPGGGVRAQSVYWLFCWAEIAMEEVKA
jgi:hypothetical protein